MNIKTMAAVALATTGATIIATTVTNAVVTKLT